jgi:hypothetical protein
MFVWPITKEQKCKKLSEIELASVRMVKQGHLKPYVRLSTAAVYICNSGGRLIIRSNKPPTFVSLDELGFFTNS